MAKPRVISVRSPVGGIDRSADYQSEPPYTAYDSLDVLPIDCKTMRERCAVRPGWVELGSLDNANLIGTVALAASESNKRQLVAASGGTLYKWTGATWSSVGTGITTGRPLMGAPYMDKFYIANDGTPKVYDFTGATVTNLTASDGGTVPTNCRIVFVWDDRLGFAGDPSNPGALFLSRQRDPTGWLFADEDTGSPVGSGEVDTMIREPITACIPHDHRCLIVSGLFSMSVFVNNPMAGGSQRTIPTTMGVTNRTAWCRDPSGITYMMTRYGLATMPPGCGDIPTIVSGKIPDELRDIDGITREAYLAPNPLFHGIDIVVTGGTQEHWFYNTRRGGFWRITPAGASIAAMHWHPWVETEDKSGMLVATSTGVYRWDRTAAIGGATKAFLTFNPIRIGGPLGGQAIVNDTRFAFGENTNDTTGTVEMACGPDGYSATQMPAGYKSSTTIGSLAGNRGWQPRVGNHAMAIKITQGDTSKHWSLEDSSITVLPCGLSR